MKKFWFFATLLCGWLLLAGCNNTSNTPEVTIEEPVTYKYTVETSTNTEESKSLVIYFSPTWHTKQMAAFISEIINSDITEIVPVTGYTTEDLNWRDETSRTFTEFKNPDIRPELLIETAFDGYDTIYLWYPIWFGITPNIILTLLDNYGDELAGKNIALFCTSEHVWIENSVEYLSWYNLNIIGSHRFAQDATKEDVQAWLESL